MSISKTVIINCAGIGSRLGMGITKSLIALNGKTLIEWQLLMLKEIQNIRIVVGFQAEELIQEVLKIRRDVIFVFNHEYLSTKTATSLALGAKEVDGIILSLDGDLLVHPDDFAEFIKMEEESIGYCEKSTEEPVLINIENYKDRKEMATKFSRQEGNYEWTGLVQLNSNKIKLGYGHVYEMIQHELPLKGFQVRCVEIDTPKDYDNALKWINDYKNDFNNLRGDCFVE